MGNLGLFAKGIAMTHGISGIGRPVGVIVNSYILYTIMQVYHHGLKEKKKIHRQK